MLNERDREIVAAAMLRADQRPQEVAAATGYREHVVRYVLQKALSQGFIQRRTYVNIYALGYTPVSVYCAFASISSEQRQRVKKFLIEHQSVSYVGEIGGEYDLSLNFCVRSAEELKEILAGISAKFGNWYRKRIISPITSFNDYPLKFFSSKRSHASVLTIQSGVPLVEIDELDHQILCKLSGGVEENALAHALSAPRSTISYRLRRLKEQKVVVGARFLPDFRRLRFQGFKCHLALSSDRVTLRDALRRFCVRDPNVAYSFESVGEPDFCIGAAVENVDDISELLNRIRAEFSNDVLAFGLFPYLRLLKSSFYPFREHSFRRW